MLITCFFAGLRKTLDGVAMFLTPPRCRVCRDPLLGHGNPLLCPGCLAGVRWIGPAACAVCGHPAGPHATPGSAGCRRCRGRGAGLTGLAAVARYGGGAGHLIRALKFGGERALADSMSGLMAERWRVSPFSGRADLVVPLSLHRLRLRQRGFDQAGLLAEGVARELGAEYGDGCVSRTRHTRPQATLSRADRLRNMEGVFAAGGELAGRRILLVDDVVTTGATMAACARACREAGATRVYGLCFAR